MFLDDSACNLASFNLMKFLTPGGQFDIPTYRHGIAILTTAMEIIVDAAGYPTEQISKNSHDYRPARPRLRQPRRAPHGPGPPLRLRRRSRLRRHAHRHPLRRRLRPVRPPRRQRSLALGAATPLTQSRRSITGGACPGFYVNREPFLDVIRMHRAEVNNIDRSP